MKFILKVRHDKGIVRIHTWAQSLEGAKRQVMAAERCPERAIREVRVIDEDDFEMVLHMPTVRVELPVAGMNVRTSGVPTGRRGVDMMPTRYLARTIDNRWRRVYSTRHTGTRFIIHDGHKVAVNLPGDLT